MALSDLTITSTYKGETAGEYIAAAIQSADTLSKDIIKVLPNIKYQTTLNKYASSNGTVNYACGWTPAGSVTLTEKLITPKKLMVNYEFCKQDFIASFEDASMGFGAKNENLPVEFEKFFLGQVLEEQAFKIEQDIWHGSGSVDGETQGFLTDWASDSNIITGSATQVAITNSNVIEKLGDVYDVIPNVILDKPDLKFIVSPNVARAYRRALSALGFRNDYTVGEKPLDFEGMDLITIAGLPASTMVVFQTKNLYFGTDLAADFNEIRSVDTDDTALDGNIRFKMVYSGDTQYIVSEEIVLYTV